MAPFSISRTDAAAARIHARSTTWALGSSGRRGRAWTPTSGSTPQRIDVDLRFTKPWKAHNQVALSLTPVGEATDVTWTMTGENKGLAQLKAVAEA